MEEEKLLWIIPVTDKRFSIKDIPLTRLNDLAKQFGYLADFTILLSEDLSVPYTAESICETTPHTIRVYDKRIKLNTQIMKELETADYAKVMVTNAHYLKQEETLSAMLEKSKDDEIDIVHLEKKRLGFYGELTHYSKAIYNKVVKMFTNSSDKMFIRNCVIFNRIILELMQDFPNKSSAMRETSAVIGANTATIVVDNKFKTQGLSLRGFSQLVSSIGMCVFAVALFVIICTVRMDIDTLLWLIIACIGISVAGVIFINYSILQEKIRIDNFSLDSTKAIAPATALSFNQVKQVVADNAEEATIGTTKAKKAVAKQAKASSSKATTSKAKSTKTKAEKTAKEETAEKVAKKSTSAKTSKASETATKKSKSNEVAEKKKTAKTTAKNAGKGTKTE